MWWLVAALLVAGLLLAALLLARAHRRRLWRQQLASAETELAWFARDLLPQLSGSGSLEGVEGGWQVGQPRVTALEDQLTALESSAPTPEEQGRALGLRDAVRAARAQVDAVLAGDPQDLWVLALDEASATLASAAGVPS